jgi:ethanolamine-phosphate cytidylyltransferase
MARSVLEQVQGQRSLQPVYDALRASHVVQHSVQYLHRGLKVLGLQEPYPKEEQLLATLTIMVVTLVLYYVFFGKRHRARRELLAAKLAEAERKVSELALQIDELDHELDEEGLGGSHHAGRKPVRVFMDGAFDLLHYGHMNAFRQGRALGTHLVVGINSDTSITVSKGTAPVMNDAERTAAVKACKWVDEIIENVPYVMTSDYLSWVIEKYKIDYVVHGDDPCIVDGRDVYEDSKKRGLFRSIPRTEGVSTTDIVGRMLYLSRDHHDKSSSGGPNLSSDLRRERKRSNSVSSINSEGSQHGAIDASTGTFFRPSRFLTTSRMLRIFSAGTRDPEPGSRIGYLPGVWDMFHMGHISTMMKAREHCDYLIVGVHSDKVVNKMRGKNFPIMNLNERLLSVLGCRYVSDVLIDAPWEITREMIASLNITVVFSGTVSDQPAFEEASTQRDGYTLPRELGILKEIKSESNLTVEEIVQRIFRNEQVFANKVSKKMKAEGEYYSNRYGFDTAQGAADMASSSSPKKKPAK